MYQRIVLLFFSDFPNSGQIPWKNDAWQVDDKFPKLQSQTSNRNGLNESDHPRSYSKIAIDYKISEEEEKSDHSAGSMMARKKACRMEPNSLISMVESILQYSLWQIVEDDCRCILGFTVTWLISCGCVALVCDQPLFMWRIPILHYPYVALIFFMPPVTFFFF